jgi:hypothetical protein
MKPRNLITIIKQAKEMKELKKIRINWNWVQNSEEVINEAVHSASEYTEKN